MKAIRDVYAKGPFQGYWRIAQASGGQGGFKVGRKRVLYTG